MVLGFISPHDMGDLHICEDTIDAEDNVGILERHMLPSRQLFPGTPCQFQQDNARPHSAKVTTAWLHRHKVRVLEWPACRTDLSPIENVLRIMKRRIRQLRPQTVEQLKYCILQEWAKIPKNSTCMLPNVFECVAGINYYIC